MRQWSFLWLWLVCGERMIKLLCVISGNVWSSASCPFPAEIAFMLTGQESDTQNDCRKVCNEMSYQQRPFFPPCMYVGCWSISWCLLFLCEEVVIFRKSVSNVLNLSHIPPTPKKTSVVMKTESCRKMFILMFLSSDNIRYCFPLSSCPSVLCHWVCPRELEKYPLGLLSRCAWTYSFFVCMLRVYLCTCDCR